MEKNRKEPETSKHRSYFVMKVLLLVLSVVVVVQFIIMAKGFTSLNERLKSLEEEKVLEEKHEPGKRRSKRSTEVTDIKKQLLKLEERFNKSYQYLGSKHVFLLPGPPGKPGQPGPRGEPGARGKAGPKGLMGIQGESAEVGVTYIRWGKKTCPNTGATLVYRGYVGGTHWTQTGGASNYVCLTRDPIYSKYQSGYQLLISRIYGAEYQTYSTGIFPSSLHDHDVPCAVCHVTKRSSQMMIPGRNICPAGWTREYKGYLMSEKHDHHRTMYTCS